jgi:hypothetical protein
MRVRLTRSLIGLTAAGVSLTLGIVACRTSESASQGQTSRAAARGRTGLRTAWGDPDLQGIWSNATPTPLERPGRFGERQEFSEEEAEQIGEQLAKTRSTDNAPPKGDPGTYNEFWWERGKLLKQTSLIVDPPDGKIPALTPDGQRRADAHAAAMRAHGPADSWEDRNLHERCILYHGVPPLPTGYNNNYQIVQTRGVVAILHEMIHEVRFIPLDGRPHVGPGIRQWMGDSRGHWEGETLVVDTSNFNQAGGGLFELNRANLRGSGETLHVVERFTRTGRDTIDYRFTIDDPGTFTRPWTGSIPMTRTDGPIFEYACHEGNYAMAGMLGGARAQERASAAPAVKTLAQEHASAAPAIKK